jgi:hypothetical protein
MVYSALAIIMRGHGYAQLFDFFAQSYTSPPYDYDSTVSRFRVQGAFYANT